MKLKTLAQKLVYEEFLVNSLVQLTPEQRIKDRIMTVAKFSKNEPDTLFSWGTWLILGLNCDRLLHYRSEG